jgi:hypothetical protein
MSGCSGAPDKVAAPVRLAKADRHHDANAGRDAIKDERVHHSGSDSRAKNAAARRKISFSCSGSRTRLPASRSCVESDTPSSAMSRLPVNLLSRAASAGLPDPGRLMVRDGFGHRSGGFRPTICLGTIAFGVAV